MYDAKFGIHTLQLEITLLARVTLFFFFFAQMESAASQLSDLVLPTKIRSELTELAQSGKGGHLNVRNLGGIFRDFMALASSGGGNEALWPHHTNACCTKTLRGPCFWRREPSPQRWRPQSPSCFGD